MKRILAKSPEVNIKEIIFRFIDPEEYDAFVFGSRAGNKAARFSDYDIGVSGKKPLSLKNISLIREALEESDIPFKVDLVDFSTVSPSFKKQALSRTIKL